MKLPKFTKENRNMNPSPPWEKELEEGDFISCSTSYVLGGYWDLFDEYVFDSPMTGDITYFVYDPVKHGAPKEGKYPVLMWIHGTNCAIDGRKCVGYCGAEQYASPEYQKSMSGGAFIVVPLANEKRLADDTISGSWDERYLMPVKKLFDAVCEKHAVNIGSRFVMGASSGGYFTWRMIELFTQDFDGAIPIASGYVPSAKKLKKLDDSGIRLIVAHGRHDEMAVFKKCIAPREEELLGLKNCICFFPEWVRNEDKGVASVNYGTEMGQHCLVNQFQANLLFDDRTCYDERLPEGVTGWIREVAQSV